MVEWIFTYGWTTLLRFHLGFSQHVCSRRFHFLELVPVSVRCLVGWHKTGRMELNDVWAQRSWPFDLCLFRLRFLAVSRNSSWLRMNSISASSYLKSFGQNSYWIWGQMLKVITSSGLWIIFFLLAGVASFCDLLLIRDETSRWRPKLPRWRWACWGCIHECWIVSADWET